MDVYLVGGAVRDELLGLRVHERDYVVVGATPEQLIDKGYEPVGRDFPVFLHPDTKEEYALARTERKSGAGYTGFTCYAAPDVTLEQDLERRDLTINAIAKSKTGELFDPFNGQRDLEKRLLRHVSPAFEEDPLRVLRVARFAARFYVFGFSIHKSTLKLLQKITSSGELKHLTGERVWMETVKALRTQNPEVYFDLLHEIGALEQILNHKLPEQLHWPALIYEVQKAQRTIDDKHAIARRYALFVSDLSDESGNISTDAIHDALKVSNLCRKSSEALEHLRRFLVSDNKSAEEALEVYRRLDAWRQESFAQFILETADSLPLSWSQRDWLQQLIQGIDALKQVSVEDVIKQGHKGSEIGQALYERRKECLEALWNLNPATSQSESH